MRKTIDINCDMGESFGHFQIGNDKEILPHVSSCNIACGFHGGDPYTIYQTLELAAKYGKNVGAHPSYLNLRGFGRETMDVPTDRLEADLIYQISALSGMAKSAGTKISYVKPHGFLYHQVGQKDEIAYCLLSAVEKIDSSLAIMGFPYSRMEEICRHKGFRFIREGYLDRRYLSGGKLLSRKEQGAILHSPPHILQQMEDILLHGMVRTFSGDPIPLEVESLCIHGDHPNSAEIAREVFHHLEKISIDLQAFQ